MSAPAAAASAACRAARVAIMSGNWVLLDHYQDLEPLKEFVKSVEEHWDGIISWHVRRISNGLLEGTNSLIQAAKARARGYRSKRKMVAITYLIAGKLPTPSPFVTHTM